MGKMANWEIEAAEKFAREQRKLGHTAHVLVRAISNRHDIQKGRVKVGGKLVYPAFEKCNFGAGYRVVVILKKKTA